MVPEPELDDPGIDVAAIIAEEAEAARRKAAIEAGRRRAGTAGAAMAGIMLAISDIYEPKNRDEVAVVAEAPSDPVDIDADGIGVTLDDVDVWAPPVERTDGWGDDGAVL
ncbi:MAG: hypothetical protein AAFZ07_25765 [Actinomycetota bacterium]